MRRAVLALGGGAAGAPVAKPVAVRADAVPVRDRTASGAWLDTRIRPDFEDDLTSHPWNGRVQLGARRGAGQRRVRPAGEIEPRSSMCRGKKAAAAARAVRSASARSCGPLAVTRSSQSPSSITRIARAIRAGSPA